LGDAFVYACLPKKHWWLLVMICSDIKYQHHQYNATVIHLCATHQNNVTIDYNTTANTPIHDKNKYNKNTHNKALRYKKQVAAKKIDKNLI
jgi:hypothetical protein